MDMPKVSVCMITYNHAPFIRQAIDSALMQRTNFEYEIVIGEDYSPDNTRAIVAEYAQRHPGRIRMVDWGENVGMSRNFAQTFLACRGQYVALLEGDDYWTDPDKLQKQVDALDAHADWAICFHTVRFFAEDGSVEPYLFPRDFDRPVSTLDDLLSGNFMQTCSLMVRNGLVDHFPTWFYDLKLADWPFSMMHALHGDMGYLNEVMADYRIHVGGVWSMQQRLFRQIAVTDMKYAMVSVLSQPQRRRLVNIVANRYFNLAWDLLQRGERADAARLVRKGWRLCCRWGFPYTFGLKRLVQLLSTSSRRDSSSDAATQSLRDGSHHR